MQDNYPPDFEQPGPVELPAVKLSGTLLFLPDPGDEKLEQDRKHNGQRNFSLLRTRRLR
jgi:hypothetical protein